MATVMRWVGVCERAFDILCRHAAARELAPGRRLGEKQLVQARANGFTAHRLAPYEGWETFRHEARRLWDVYRQTVRPKVARVAVRYGALGGAR